MLIFIIIFLCFIVFYLHKTFSQTSYALGLDDKHYMVRDLHDKKKAAETLSIINKNIQKLLTRLQSINKYKVLFNTLSKNYSSNLSEGVLNNNFTSYTVNKGEKIVFCLRNKSSNQIHRINLLMFVALHELSHIGTSSIGHTPEFNKNFKILLEEAIEIGIYKNENFSQNPTSYCGTIINKDFF